MTAGIRRLGLTKGGFNGPSLHRRTVANSRNSSSGTNLYRVHPEDEDDITCSPEGSDDEDTSFLPTNLIKQPSSSQLSKENLGYNDFDPIRKQRISTTSSEDRVGSSPPPSSWSTTGDVGSQVKKIRLDTRPEPGQTSGSVFGTLKAANGKSSKNVAKYGIKQSQGRQQSQSRRGVKAGRLKSNSPERRFKQYPEHLKSTSPQREFRNYDFDIEFNSTPDIRVFKSGIEQPSPERSPSLPRFKAPELLDSLFDDGGSPRLKASDAADISTKGKVIPRFNREIADSFDLDSSSLEVNLHPPAPRLSPKNEDGPKSHEPKFKVREKIVEFLNSDYTQYSDITTDLFGDSELFVDDVQKFDDPMTKPDRAICPMCGDVVDSEFLRTYNNGNPMNVRKQIKFCCAHKKRSAEDTWISRGYPAIDWGSLDERISKHHRFLGSLLNGTSSYYREILSECVKSGKNRTLKQCMMSSDMPAGPGYYGSRGLRAMSENIMNKFSPQLRRIAVVDRLVAARGVIGYVQAVLVPELAVQLIREDMEVTTEEARKIMGESVGLGDILNDELQDVVVSRDNND